MPNQPKTASPAAYTSRIPKNPLRFILYISKRHRFWLFFAFLTMTLAQILGIYGFYVIAQLIDGFAGAATKAKQLDVLFFWGFIYLVLISLERFSWRASGFLGVKWLVEISVVGYKSLYRYLIQHSHTYFIDRFAGTLSGKVSSGVDSSARLAERLLWGIVPEVVSVLATLYLFWTVHWMVALILSVAIGLVFVLNLWFVKRRRPFVIAYSKINARTRGEGIDLVTNIAAARQYVRRDEEMNRLSKTLQERAQKDKKQWFMGERLMVINTVISITVTGLILAYVYILLRQDLATVGSLVLVLGLLTRIGHLFANMGNMLNGFIRQYGEAEDGLEEILIEHEIVDVPGAPALSVAQGTVEWRVVDFKYDENQVFKDFDLKIRAGERVGLVGASGAGKTTFVSLLLRQHDIQSGAIEIDGQNIAEVTQDSLRANIAVVPQEPLLFHRTIRENIAYGKESATELEIEAVAKQAQAHEFITALPNGYDTLVGERGVKLSGGQKQRVAIARAMLKDAPILVLDEATSALDSESEVLIQKALHQLMEGKTVIAIAHRLSTLREMDRIIVLEQGQIVEDGNHETLTHAGGTYQRLWEHQAGGFLQE